MKAHNDIRIGTLAGKGFRWVLLPGDLFFDEVTDFGIDFGQRRLTVSHLSSFSTRR